MISSEAAIVANVTLLVSTALLLVAAYKVFFK